MNFAKIGSYNPVALTPRNDKMNEQMYKQKDKIYVYPSAYLVCMGYNYGTSLSYDVTSESVIKPCRIIHYFIKIYKLHRNVMR